MKVSIGRAARELGVSRETLRRWESEGRIEVDRASNGRRRYDLTRLGKLTAHSNTSNTRQTIGYARVSSPEQWGSLGRQVSLLESYCTINGWAHQVIKDTGTGVDYRNTGLRELIARICDGEVGRLVVPNVERLPRLGMELLLAICEIFNTEVVILNALDSEDTRQELSDDIDGMVSLFAARLYESLDEDKPTVVSKLRQVAEELRAG
jgi:predicted site-specific integrase-resolvase